MITIGVFGVRGIVGQLMLKQLEESPYAKDYKVLGFGRQDKPQKVDIAILCTDETVSPQLAPELKNYAKFVIDMSSYFRQKEGVPLVIPEINANTITKDTWLIASPNCTVTGLVLALNPLKKYYTLEEVFSSSYQAISGGGKKLLEEFENPNSLYRANCVPLIGSVKENGFTSEELKGIYEAKKILGLPNLRVFSHTVRVPVKVSHGLTITLRAKEEFNMQTLPDILRSQKGVILDGKVYTNKEVEGRGEAFISRLRQDIEDKHVIHFWCVCDNLLKGAALNGRQIADYLFEEFFND